MTNLDKDRVLEALRNSIQSPRQGELLIHQIEQGEFDAATPSKAGGKEKASPAGE